MIIFGIVLFYAMKYKSRHVPNKSVHKPIDHASIPDNIPSVLIIGAQKSGTTFLRRVLSDQNEIKVYPKEQHYLVNNRTSKYLDEIFTPTLEEYSTELYKISSYNRNTHILVEKTPEYMLFPEEVIEVMPGDTKYIVLLRDPIDRAYSAYLRLQRHNKIDEGRTFEQILLNPDAKLYTTQIPHCFQRSPFSLINRGKYEIFLSRWFLHTRPENIHIIFTEDLGNYDWNKLRRFLNMRESFIMKRQVNIHNHRQKIHNGTISKLLKTYLPYNRALCRLLRKYQYKCPSWAT
tara:strand:+ start:9570 stop:10439 length:870 start_codon:yes stop_codon:yes gene_type:complete